MSLNLDIPKMGYYLLTKHDNGFVGEQIRREQVKAGFSQVDALFTHVEVLGGGQYSVRVAPPRSSVIDITEKYKGRYVKIVKYNNTEYESKGRYKIAFWAASNCNKRYDWFGILRFKINWLFKQAKGLPFCSENALWASQKEFPEMMNGLEPHKCMPAHFCSLTTVWKGIIEA